jgi:hypothetical protein
MSETTDIVEIAAWRARKMASSDTPIGAPPFVLREPCPGCGARRVTTMVWRTKPTTGGRVAFPRVAPHFLCRDGRILWQEITDAPIPVSAWSGIFGQFEAAQGG